MEEKNWKAEIRKTLDETMSNKEALEVLKASKIYITLARKNGKNRVYLALMKAYFALEDAIKGEEK